MKYGKYSKDINDCDECPLFMNDCRGGFTSDGSGEPIEPPCFNWDDETLVTEHMYSSQV